MTNANEILIEQVTLDIECIDRLYLNGYIPQMQTSGGLVYYLRQKGFPIPSPVIVGDMTTDYRKQVKEFAQSQGIPLIEFEKGQRKDDVVAEYRQAHSDDNPYSEAQFRTLKYSPGYPDRFDSLADTHQWCQGFFIWYNQEHHHTSLCLLTPADVHYGRADEKLAQRHEVLLQAYEAHPERFVNGPPTMSKLPDAVWINPPKEADSSTTPPMEPVC